MIEHLVFDGVADGPLGLGLDVVSTAARLAQMTDGSLRPDVLQQRIASIDGKAIRTAAGRNLEVDGTFRPGRLGARDVVVLPGLSAATPAEANALLERSDIVRGCELLRQAAARRASLAASCSATFVLGASRLLDGRQATTTWWLAANFARRFPKTSLSADRMVVESKRVLTAGSAFAHADLMLALIARIASPSLAHLVARYLVLDERPSQARYIVQEHLRTSDPTVRRLEDFVRANLHRQLTLTAMAKATATSPRTLARRVHDALGTTPQLFARRLRVAQAAHLLETTGHSIEAIAARVGYADTAAFRRTFRDAMGEPPSHRRTRR